MAAPSSDVEYREYANESTLPELMALIEKDLSEPYSVYTYRYFIYNWPQLCQLVGVDPIGLLQHV
jgi:peptide alpha-N-acetyltransferase